MTRKLLFLLLSVVLLCACNDNLEFNSIPLEEQDEFAGELKKFILQKETAAWEDGVFRLKIMTEDGKIIVRSAEHKRSSEESLFKMNTGLKSGIYRLLSADIEVKVSQDSIMKKQYGLGRRIDVDSEKGVTLLGTYDEWLGLVKEDSVYIVSCAAHLNRLRELSNSEQSNRLLLEKNIYQQKGPIDMNDIVVDRISGWMPIGSAPTTAFRGTFIGDSLNPIKNLKINRENSLGIGLFGFVQNFTAKNVTLQNANVKGHSFVGALVGAVVTAGNARDESYFYKCKLNDCTITGADGGLSVGGLVGMVDQYVDVLFVGCSTENGSCSGAYNVGGLLGGTNRYSRTFVSDCVNESTPITGKFNCVGGLIGVADSLSMSVCLNKAEVNGGTDASGDFIVTGTGGLAGGSGTACLLACKNEASVKGHWGVGGLIGSSRIATEKDGQTVFGNAYFQECINSADVFGDEGVGGICGEAQFGGYGLYNKGNISGIKYIGGLCGNTSIAVVQNTVNNGELIGDSHIGGLVGKALTGSLTLSQNYGSIVSHEGYAGGVVGLMGDNVLIHYCANHAALENQGKSPVGGIVGEIGDPREWSPLDITYCVYGVADMVMGPLGAGIDFAKLVRPGQVVSLVNMFLAVSGFSFRTTFSYMEEVDQVLSFEGCFNEVELAKINDDITKKENEWRKDIDDLLAGVRNNQSVSYFTDSGLNATLLGTPYMSNFNGNLAYTKASKENSDAFNENCNARVNELAGEVKFHEEMKETVHTVISYITVGVGAVATVVGMVVTGGSLVAIVATAVGAASTFIGGANSVWRGVDNFEENAVIISQCVNTGSISASDGKVGGIVGVLNDYGSLHDCINAGSGPGTLGSQLVDDYGHNCSISRNLSIASSETWSHVSYGNSVYEMDYSNFLFDVNNSACLDLTDIASEEVFKKQKWNIGETNAYWTIPNADYPHPIPDKSEMRE